MNALLCKVEFDRKLGALSRLRLGLSGKAGPDDDGDCVRA